MYVTITLSDRRLSLFPIWLAQDERSRKVETLKAVWKEGGREGKGREGKGREGKRKAQMALFLLLLEATCFSNKRAHTLLDRSMNGLYTGN